MKHTLIAAGIFMMGILQFTNANSQGAPAIEQLAPGSKAPVFKLKNVDGKTVSLEDYKGAIVVFTCNHCPFSKKYEGRIMELDKKYAKQGYPVLAINSNDSVVEPDDSYTRMQEVAKSKKYSFPYLLDNTQETAKAYGASRTPHVYVVTKENAGYIVKYVGAIDDNADDPKAASKHYVDDAIGSILNGKEVATPATRAIGCTIKWNKG